LWKCKFTAKGHKQNYYFLPVFLSSQNQKRYIDLSTFKKYYAALLRRR
jgi:hypothetical protein